MMLSMSPASESALLATLTKWQHGQFDSKGALLLTPSAATGQIRPQYSLIDPTPSLTSSGALKPFDTSSPTGLSPTQLLNAYNIENVKFGSVTGNGAGQTIAIVDAYDYPSAATDLHAFDQQFGLPDPPSFEKVNQSGSSATNTLPPTDTANGDSKGNDWELEESLDIEWAHAIAPMANIILVECNSSNTSDLVYAGVNWARSASGVTAVSMSWGGPESSSDPADNGYYTTPAGHPGVTFLAATGDNGSPSGSPAYSPNVVAVGGTTLSVDGSGNVSSETGWSGSGGGISQYQTKPAYQNGIVTQSSQYRCVPDISFDADPNSGVSVYDTYDFGTSAPWAQIGGTSLATPCWAGVIAIADQGRAVAGLSSLDGATQTLPALYSAPASDFRDITSGSNGGYSAGPGYDLVTGRGTPLANLLIPYLVGNSAYVTSSTPSGSLTTAPTQIDFNFSTTMSPTGFSISSGVDSFTGPGNVDLRSTITGYAWANNDTTLELSISAPTTTGTYSITIGPDILSSGGAEMDQNQNGVPGEAGDTYSTSFLYNPNPLQVTSATPTSGSIVSLPFSSLTLHFNKAVEASTVNASDLTLSQGTVAGASLIDPTDVQFTLSGVGEGAVNASVAAGAIDDSSGLPMLAWSGSFTGNAPVQSFPALTASVPLGSEVYTGQTSDSVYFANDTHEYTLSLAAGQTLSLYATGSGGLTPSLTLLDPGSNTLATNTAASANGTALLESVAIASAGTYTIEINGASSTTGSFTLGAALNAAYETGAYGGASNSTIASAQSISGAFKSVGASGGSAIADVLGNNLPGSNPVLFSDNFENGLGGITVTNTYGSMWHLSIGHGAESGHSQSHSMYFGQGETATGGGNYDDGSRVAGYIATPLIALPTGLAATVNFNYILQTEANTGYDLAELQISTNGFQSYTTLAQYNVVAESSSWKAATPVSLSAYEGHTVQLRWFFDSVDQYYNDYEGWYVDDINVSTAPPPATEVYSFNLNAGDSVSLALSTIVSGTTGLQLEDGSGNVLASSATGASNYDRGITDYTAASAGTYYAVVTGASNTTYSLLVSKDAEFDTHPNNSTSTAQPLNSTAISGTQTAVGAITSGATDYYSIKLSAGQVLTLTTTTPGMGGQPNNTLDPLVTLLDPSLTQVAQNQNSAPDGINAELSYTAVSSGTYYIAVGSTTSASTTGDYTLSANVAASQPFDVTSSSISSGSYVNAATTSVTLKFNVAVDSASVQASALTVDSTPATGYTINADGSITFTLPALTQGQHTLALAAGALSSTSASALSAYSETFTYDTAPPTISGSSLPAVTSAGASYSFTVSYADNFALSASSLGAGAVTVSGPNGFTEAAALATNGISGSGAAITATYTITPPGGAWALADDGMYTVSLNASAVQDLAGNFAPAATIGTFSVAILPAAPGAPSLLAATDSGVSSSDHLTNFNNSSQASALQFSVANTVPGATVTLYAGATAIGSAVASGTSTNVTTDGSTVLADGVYSITATQTYAALTSSASSTSSLTIDTTPAAAGGLVGPNVLPALSARTFTITYTDANAVSLASVDSSAPLVTGPNAYSASATFQSANVSSNSSSITATYLVPAPAGGWTAAANGAYSVSLPAGQISDTAGNLTAAGVVGTFSVNIAAQLSAPTLSAATDSGVSNSDGITNFNNSTAARALQFIVTGAFSGATITLYADGNAIGSAVAGSGPTTVTTNGTTTLSDGAHQFTVRQASSSAGQSISSAATSVTIDTATPSAPATPTLAASSDTGISQTDGITSQTSPVVQVTLSQAGVVHVEVDGNSATVVTQSASAAGTVSVQLSNLSAGKHSIVAWESDVAGNNSANSSALTITIDTTAPTISGYVAPATSLAAGSARTFTVTFADNVAVSVASLGGKNILVTGPNGYSQLATFVSATPNSNSASITATYTAPAPTAGWTPAANGTYTVTLQSQQVSDTAGNITASAKVGTFAVAISSAPGTPALAAASDSGISNSDRITNFNNTSSKKLQFTVSGTTAGATVTIYSDGTAIGSAVATGSTTTITTNGTYTLSNGTHQITARQTLSGGPQSSASGALTITVNTTAPKPNTIPTPKGAVSSIAISFTEAVYGLALSNFTLTHNGASVSLSSAKLTTSNHITWTLSNLSSLLTKSGTYVLTLKASSGVTDTAGNVLASGTSVTWKI